METAAKQLAPMRTQANAEAQQAKTNGHGTSSLVTRFEPNTDKQEG